MTIVLTGQKKEVHFVNQKRKPLKVNKLQTDATCL